MKKKLLFVWVLLLALFYINFNVCANASSYIMIDAKTKTILKGSNYHCKSLIASTAKIMTSMVAIENGNLFDFVEITYEDVAIEGSKIYAPLDDQMLLYDLLCGLMLRSGNDAANAICRSVYGDKDAFIRQMNELAKSIGMYNSTFANASGLDAKEYNLSTAYDMAILTAYACKNEAFMDIASKKKHSAKTKDGNTFAWQNKHKLVTSDERFVLGKTGYTKKSGRILVSLVTYNNIDAVIVTINDPNDWQTHKRLCDSLNNYKNTTILKKGNHNLQEIDSVFWLDESLVVPINKNKKNNLKIEYCILGKKCIICLFCDNVEIFKEEIWLNS